MNVEAAPCAAWGQGGFVHPPHSTSAGQSLPSDRLAAGRAALACDRTARRGARWPRPARWQRQRCTALGRARTSSACDAGCVSALAASALPPNCVDNMYDIYTCIQLYMRTHAHIYCTSIHRCNLLPRLHLCRLSVLSGPPLCERQRRRGSPRPSETSCFQTKQHLHIDANLCICVYGLTRINAHGHSVVYLNMYESTCMCMSIDTCMGRATSKYRGIGRCGYAQI